MIHLGYILRFLSLFHSKFWFVFFLLGCRIIPPLYVGLCSLFFKFQWKFSLTQCYTLSMCWIRKFLSWSKKNLISNLFPFAALSVPILSLPLRGVYALLFFKFHYNSCLTQHYVSMRDEIMRFLNLNKRNKIAFFFLSSS